MSTTPAATSQQPDQQPRPVSPGGRKARFYNPEVQAQARRMREQGRKLADIARVLGCAPGSVSGLCRATPRQRGYVLPADAVQRYTVGEPIDRIAAEIGCRPATALRMLAKAGADVPTTTDLHADIVTRYTTKRQTIRGIAVDLHHSYGYVHGVLTAAGVSLRPRGGPRPRKPQRQPHQTVVSA